VEREEKSKGNGNAHFGISHFCAGCPVSTKLHTGCVINHDFRVINSDGSVRQTWGFTSPSEKEDLIE